MVLDLGQQGWKRSQSFVPQSWKGSQIYDLGPNKVPDFSSQFLEKSQIQVQRLGKRQRCSSQVLIKVLVLVPRSQKRPRFSYKGLENVQDVAASSQKRFQIFVLSPGKVPRFMPQVLIKALVLGPRFRFQVLGKVIDLGFKSWKRSQKRSQI